MDNFHTEISHNANQSTMFHHVLPCVECRRHSSIFYTWCVCVCVITRVLIIGSWQFLPFGETFVYVRLSFTALMAHTCSVTIFVDFPTHRNGEENWGFVFIFCQSDVSDYIYVSGMIFWKYIFSMKKKNLSGVYTTFPCARKKTADRLTPEGNATTTKAA